jgi:hypothetical protein
MVVHDTDLLPTMNGEGSCYCGEVWDYIPSSYGFNPGWVSGPLPLSLSGLGVMHRLLIIANRSKYLILITEIK